MDDPARAANDVAHTGAVLSSEIDTVVFDLGGVLIDWNPRHVYRRLFADDGEMEVDLLRELKATGLRCYALSNNGTRHALQCTSAAQLRHELRTLLP